MGWVHGCMGGRVSEWVSPKVGEWVVGIWIGLIMSIIVSKASHEIPTKIIKSGANPIRGVIGAEGGFRMRRGGSLTSLGWKAFC